MPSKKKGTKKEKSSKATEKKTSGAKTAENKTSETKVTEKKIAYITGTSKEKFNKLKNTGQIEVSKEIVNQVIGQEEAVEVIKKAASQRRHVFLIGEPGTGKSMLGLALAELLPKEKLVDILSFDNPNDENQPLIRTVPAGEGRALVTKAKLDSTGFFKNQNIILFIFAILAMLAPWWIR
jgi:ATP-dependent Lon protease